MIYYINDTDGKLQVVHCIGLNCHNADCICQQPDTPDNRQEVIQDLIYSYDE